MPVALRDAAEGLTLIVDGQKLTGWTEIEVTRGVEMLPNTFQIAATDGSPVAADARRVREGAACTVLLGDDVVITGYVDAVSATIAPGDHSVRLVGRGKCADLVDCAAQWPSSQITRSDVRLIAAKLAAPFGIDVKSPKGSGPPIEQFNINVTDTVADILELLTRQASLLYYEDASGALVLADLADEDAGSGFIEGVNVQSATFDRSMAARYSTYVCSYLSVDTSGLFADHDGLMYFKAEDPNVRRFRPLCIVAEGLQGGQKQAQRRAEWEASRRAGRSRKVRLVTDSWRDAEGRLWQPNTIAPVELPTLGLTGALYCISEVTHRQSLEGGRSAEITLMPRESFLPEPLQPFPLLPGLIGADGEAAAPLP